MSIHQGAVPELAPRAVGIGRPITQSSLDTFMEVFDGIMPAEVEFIPRAIPGANYASAETLADLVESTSVTLSQTGIATLATSVVASLCEQGKLNGETARDATRLRIDEVRHKNHDPDSFLLDMRLTDRLDDFYPQGYLIFGEKTIFEQVLGIAKSRREPRKQGRPPRTLLRLGKITGDPRLVTTPKLAKIKKVFSEHVELGPVGHVTSS
ncbi:MAG TPA: hypothetical protein VNG32_02955 [Candidatus Dormibacteraeota bacterium]|nr:hypothetical protein [Candidatus Dormibacteraeota bacterium]